MSAFLRRVPLSRLLILCGALLGFGVGLTALAFALGTGPTPPPKPLAQAVHDALTAPPVSGVSARIQLTSHLIEGANLQGGQEGPSPASNPLLTGSTGRLWLSSDGKARLELQSEQGDTQIFYDGQTLSLYDASSNTLYRYTPPAQPARTDSDGKPHIPSVAEIEETISHIMRHADLSGAVPTDVAGQAAYSVRISPSQDGGLVGGAELAWDAVHGVPLSLSIYSSTSSAPVLQLTATDVSYGPVADSIFAFSPPPGAKITDVNASNEEPGNGDARAHKPPVRGLSNVQAAVPFTIDAPSTLGGLQRNEPVLIASDHHPAALISYGKGLAGITVLESQASPRAEQDESSSQSMLGQLPTVSIGSSKATEVPTALGTLLSFRRAGVSYLLAGSVTAGAIEAAARGL